MLETIKQSILMYLVLTALCGLIYPFAMTALAQVVFPHQANGSMIVDEKNGKLIGSELLGQQFSSEDYFWSRLSATSPPFNAGASSGSNLGPLNQNLIENARERVLALKKSGGAEVVPVDLVTSSASGLDPDISIASARYQAPRVARARGVSEEDIKQLIVKHESHKQFAILGEPRVNVLKLNLALDQSFPAKVGSNRSP